MICITTEKGVSAENLIWSISTLNYRWKVVIACRFSGTRSTKQTIYKHNCIKIMVIETLSQGSPVMRLVEKSLLYEKAVTEQIAEKCSEGACTWFQWEGFTQKCGPRFVVRNQDMWRYPVTKEMMVNFWAMQGIRREVCPTGHGPKGNSGQAGEISGRISLCRSQLVRAISEEKEDHFSQVANWTSRNSWWDDSDGVWGNPLFRLTARHWLTRLIQALRSHLVVEPDC